MEKKSKFLLFLGILPVVLVYNNCGGYQKNESGKTNTSTTCKVGPSAVLKLQGFNAATDCQGLIDIRCEARIFNPEIADGILEKEECLEDDPSSCLTVTHRSYNTAAAGGEVGDYLPGGSYNYQEYNCYDPKFNHNGHPIIQSSASSLNEAVEKLQNHCLALGDE